MFGPDLLIAAVLYEGAREGYLLVGTTWKDAWTDEVFQGAQTITADPPLKHLPFYLKGEKLQPIKA